MSTQTNISVGLNDLATLTNTLTPLLAAYIPAVAGNQQLINLGTSAAQSLATIISNIPISSGTITVEQQSALLSKLYGILAGTQLNSPEWKIQT